jgi:hypothetical protein
MQLADGNSHLLNLVLKACFCSFVFKLLIVEIDSSVSAGEDAALDTCGGVNFISGENLVVFVVLSEHFQVLDVVLVCFHIQAEVLACQLLHLLKVDIVSKVVSPEMSLLLSMLVKPLLKLLELLDSFENVGFFRVHVISLHQLNVMCSSKSLHGFSLDATLTLNDIELLLQQLFILHIPVLVQSLSIVLSVAHQSVFSLRLFVSSFLSIRNRVLWEEISTILRKHSHHSSSWLGAD